MYVEITSNLEVNLMGMDWSSAGRSTVYCSSWRSLLMN